MCPHYEIIDIFWNGSILISPVVWRFFSSFHEGSTFEWAHTLVYWATSTRQTQTWWTRFRHFEQSRCCTFQTGNFFLPLLTLVFDLCSCQLFCNAKKKQQPCFLSVHGGRKKRLQMSVLKKSVSILFWHRLRDFSPISTGCERCLWFVTDSLPSGFFVDDA